LTKAVRGRALSSRQDSATKFAEVTSAIARIGQQAREAANASSRAASTQARWRSEDAAVAALQRQVDELKTALGGIYGARDVIIDLRERLDRMERSL
jgi:uncharacterized membrane protein